MDRILANLRAVPGVTGILVIDKKRALTYDLMPASYGAENVKEISLALLALGRAFNKNMSLDFFFESGLGRLYNKPEQVILILGKPDMNLNALGIVCREAIPAISRKLTQGQLGLTTPPSSPHSGAGVDFLISAINVIAAKCAGRLGAYLVTKNLRRAKDELAGKYPLLTAISVDNNGIASLIKGVDIKQSQNDLKAFAHWANLFLSYCAKSSGKLQPDDIVELTFEIKDRLDLAGFYQVYAESAADASA